MLKQAKFMILINVFLGFSFVLGNFALWDRVNYWVLVDVASKWSPFFVSSIYLGPPATPSNPAFYQPLFNYPFLLFWVLFALNLYFIITLGRSKETKQNP